MISGSLTVNILCSVAKASLPDMTKRWIDENLEIYKVGKGHSCRA